jgi:hypothetical protein
MLLIRALIAFLITAVLASSPSSAQIIGVSIRIGPPLIPVYVQPPIPGPGYIWAPGYWAWGDDDYYWVPGTWVVAPVVGYLWTPGYWGWSDGFYVWHRGYWGPRIGFYGGINYGCGYYGAGYVGGEWRGRVFAYNTAVTNIGTTKITNVYVNKTVIINNTTNNVSFNGGNGGTNVKPTNEELAAEHDKHIQPTDMQMKHEHAASTNHDLFSKVNGGKPGIAATSRAAMFTGKGVVGAKDAKASFHPGDLSKGGPPGAKLDSLKKGATSPNNPRVYSGKGPGSNGPNGPNGHPHVTTMRNVPHPPPGGQNGHHQPEYKRPPNQGKRPDQG